MEGTIQVARDTEGLRMAALGLLEEAYQRECIKSAVQRADAETRARALDDMDPRTLSPGYYGQAAYLFDLATMFELGISYGPADLTREDVIGLVAIRSAKAEFEREHPSCPRCGVRQDNCFTAQCRGCHMKLRRDS